MTKEELIRKLASRKFWALLAGLITSIVLMAQGDTTVTVGGIVMGAGSIVSYILGESWTDAAYVANNDPNCANKGDE